MVQGSFDQFALIVIVIASDVKQSRTNVISGLEIASSLCSSQ